jgi:hypothetical protein
MKIGVPPRLANRASDNDRESKYAEAMDAPKNTAAECRRLAASYASDARRMSLRVDRDALMEKAQRFLDLAKSTERQKSKKPRAS